jgi:hypothetical protein
MGFNKRIVHRENVMNTPEYQLNKLFDADVLFVDYWTDEFLLHFSNKVKKDEIINIINNKKI